MASWPTGAGNRHPGNARPSSTALAFAARASPELEKNVVVTRNLLLALLAFTVLAATNASATIVYCIDPTDGSGYTAQEQLNLALSDWAEYSTEPYDVRIVQGTYVLTGSTFQYYQGISHNGYGDLTLRGGYLPGCQSRTLLASNTVLTGSLTTGVLLSGVGNMLIEGLTIDNVSHFGVQFETDNALDVRKIIVRNMNVVTNGTSYSALTVAGHGSTLFRDSLVYNCTTSSAAAGATRAAVYTTTGNVTIKHVTIANNSGNGLALLTDNGSQVSATDNIVWGNSGYDLAAVYYDAGAPPPTVSYSDYGTFSSGLDLQATNTTKDPLFINTAAENYALKTMLAGWPNDSPAINTGTLSANCPGCVDLSGNPRYVGSRVDMGAYESNVDDRTNIVVTTAADNGDNNAPTTGSLRAAIKNANASAGASKITFGGSVTCPQTFLLAGQLPDITSDVTIDATTLTGWKANTLPVFDGHFNANLCVYLDGKGSIPVGLHVPASASSAQLTVSGLLMFGFTDAAIKLEAGANHSITGTQLGGAFLIANNDGIRITGNAGATIVGGYDDPSVVNLIGGATGAGIHVDDAAGGNILANNLIGFRPDGVANGNGTGVLVSQSPNNAAAYNVVASSAGFGVQILGPSATGNLLQSNEIGFGTVQTANASGGVQLAFGAAGNTIGSTAASSSGGNAIFANGGPGVWIPGGAFGGGTGNRILGNSISGNNGLAIDLGGLGPDANDVPALGTPDQDTGPNNLQNYPVITHYISTFNLLPQYKIDVRLDSTPNTTFRIDFYYGGSCTAVGSPPRGDAQEYLGHANLTTGPTGYGAVTVYMLSYETGSGYIAATATDPSGNTSEIGTCTADDQIFKNGFN